MDSELIEQVLLRLKESIKDKGDAVSLDDEKSFQADEGKFFQIGESVSNKKICFIDGGNLEILRASNFSIQTIRVYYTIYQNNKRISSNRKEFFVLLKCVRKEDKLYYEVESFGDSVIGKLSFFVYAPELKEGFSKKEISELGGVVRRLCEIRTAEECVDEIGEEGYIVLDGDLQEKTRAEHEFFQKVFFKANSRKVKVCGLAKTNSLLSDTGNSFSIVLLDKAPQGEWYYVPVVKKAMGKDTVFTKLHSKSGYVFKFEIRKENVADLGEVMGLLKRNSVDPVFLGYPYGLIEADRFARVSKNELDYLKTKFMAKAGKWYKELVPYLNTLNSHEILDNIA